MTVDSNGVSGESISLQISEKRPLLQCERCTMHFVLTAVVFDQQMEQERVRYCPYCGWEQPWVRSALHAPSAVINPGLMVGDPLPAEVVGLSTPEPKSRPGHAPVGAMVLKDIEDRIKFGRAKYSTELMTHNSRDPLRDAYQEVMDLAFYVRQEIAEREDGWRWFDLVDSYNEWVVKVFADETLGAATRHLADEAAELQRDHLPEEAADCLLMLLGVSRIMGIDLLKEARIKLEKNKARQWVKTEDGYYHHV